ncbi:MAG TPA: citrate/2-methylcitrate synthase [Acidimicrobiales bacterium]|jgi:citrate synthase|nr:citrate/2-methylcitrate synthase [Acidimicrobiales bacterium]
MLTTEEAARRLGVKVPTLYAYVSRGLLQSHPDPGRRGSLFDLSDIEALAVRSRGGRQTATRLATITTAVTQLDQRRGPIYRGEAATDLALTSTFEEVAEFLWQSRELGDWAAPDLGPCPLTQTLERMRWALVVCGATDPLRADLRPAAVARAARRATAALTDVVGPLPAGEDPTASIAARLAGRLGATATRSAGSGSAVVPTAAVNAALILLADHELATSTMAVRLAASVRSDPYDAFLAGVATLAGPLHGGASQQAFELLAMAERDGVPRALNDVLRERGLLPGFGHTVYKSGDARFGALLTLAEPLLSEERRAILHEVMELAAAHDVPLANCDLALAALSWGTGMPPDTGRTLFAVARVAGWAAHYMEELTERPLRFRARAVYSV